jgi:hypothetical protein
MASSHPGIFLEILNERIEHPVYSSGTMPKMSRVKKLQPSTVHYTLKMVLVNLTIFIKTWLKATVFAG